MKDQRPEGIEQYDYPGGGWDALKAAAKTLAHQQVVAQGTMTLLKANQPDGFDLPRCAWPDPKHTSSFEFCESGAKAISWESTAKRSGPELSKATPSPSFGPGQTMSWRTQGRCLLRRTDDEPVAPVLAESVMAAKQPARVLFGPFELNLSERSLKKADEAIPLGARAFDILATLIDRAGRNLRRAGHCCKAGFTPGSEDRVDRKRPFDRIPAAKVNIAQR